MFLKNISQKGNKNLLQNICFIKFLKKRDIMNIMIFIILRKERFS